MARYLAAMQGQAGEATRLGSPKSGIRAQAQGWDLGVKVYGEPQRNGAGDDIGDAFTVIVTGGSHAAIREIVALRVTRDDDGRIQISYDPWGDILKADEVTA